MPLTSDPFAPKSKARPTGERESTLATLVRRLRRLGATPEVVADMEENWDNFAEDWTPESRAAFAAHNDEALRLHIKAVADEWDHDTTDPETQRHRERVLAAAEAFEAVQDVIGGNVATIIDWVGDRPERAFAVRAAESAPDGANRSTLLAAIGPLADAWNADAPRS